MLNEEEDFVAKGRKSAATYPVQANHPELGWLAIGKFLDKSNVMEVERSVLQCFNVLVAIACRTVCLLFNRSP